MNFKNSFAVLLVSIALFSCKQTEEKNQTADSTEQQVDSTEQQELIFSKGERITNNNFTGNAWLEMLVDADSINRNSVGSVTFEPGARTNWHTHPNGQIILAISGEGYYQEKGSPKRILKKGDAVKCPPNVPHWHGASEDSEFIQVAITSRVDGPTEWLEAVPDAQYKGK